MAPFIQILSLARYRRRQLLFCCLGVFAALCLLLLGGLLGGRWSCHLSAQIVERKLQLLILLGVTWNIGRRSGFFLLDVLVLQVPTQTGFTARFDFLLLQVFRKLLLDDDIGINALGLNRPIARRVITRCRQPDRTVGSERNDRLNRPFAERTGTDNCRPLVILQRPGDDFRS